MAKAKSAAYPYQWPDGSWHSKPKGFTPTPAPTPPSGTYDPGLDAQGRAAGRGLLDLTQDTERDNERASTAYTATKEQSGTQRSWSLADALSGRDRTQQDLTTSHDRGTVDLKTALTRGTEDFGLNTAALGRNYAELGAGQTGKAASGAFVDTSSIAASAGKRSENQGRDQADLQRGFDRFSSDNTQSQGRLDQDFGTGMSRSNEDYGTNVARTNQSFDWQDAGAANDYQYGVDDRATGLGRALRENTFYGQDVDAAKMYQATTSGLYTPPNKPSNEFSDSKGPYQLQVANGLRWKLRPDGKREPAGVA